MGKKISWFTCVKRLFIPNPKPKQEKRSNSWKWLFGRFKFKQFPSLDAPDQKALIDATDDHRKRALAVAIATAAAAEAAVAAANAAAEIVRMTNIPRTYKKKNPNLAAVKIQSAYRGHLARKALSALKGLVKLQAVVRGELVRRRVVQKLRQMSSMVKSQTQLHQITLSTWDQNRNHEQKMQSFSLKEVSKSEELKFECKSRRSWDLSLFSKEDMEDLFLKKQEAMAKRMRMKQYSFSHREERRKDPTLRELLSHKESRRQSSQKEETEKSKSLNNFYASASDTSRLTLLKLRSASKQELIEELNSPFSLPRRSFCQNQKSIGDEGTLPNSPVFPTYMAATESAKARSISVSTPKQWLRLCDTYSGQHSPRKLNLSSLSSFNGEMNNSSKYSIHE